MQGAVWWLLTNARIDYLNLNRIIVCLLFEILKWWGKARRGCIQQLILCECEKVIHICIIVLFYSSLPCRLLCPTVEILKNKLSRQNHQHALKAITVDFVTLGADTFLNIIPSIFH